mgnify:CR=1 FL=1
MQGSAARLWKHSGIGNPNGKQSEVSPVKTPSVAKLEAMIQKSADPDTARRVWEEVLRRQQLQKDIPKVRR